MSSLEYMKSCYSAWSQLSVNYKLIKTRIKKNNRKYCVSKKCTHQGCLVSVVDKKLVCPCHGARFSLDGKVEKGPYTGEKIRNLPIKDIEDLV